MVCQYEDYSEESSVLHLQRLDYGNRSHRVGCVSLIAGKREVPFGSSAWLCLCPSKYHFLLFCRSRRVLLSHSPLLCLSRGCHCFPNPLPVSPSSWPFQCVHAAARSWRSEDSFRSLSLLLCGFRGPKSSHEVMQQALLGPSITESLLCICSVPMSSLVLS